MNQYGTTFVEGGQGHLYISNPGIGTKVMVNTKAKKVALEQIHLSASKRVEEAMTELNEIKPTKTR